MNYLNNTLLSGLHGYEIVLLGSGVLMFLVLLITLIKEFKVGTLPFFLVSVIMMGFPAIQEFSYKDGILTIKKEVNQILEGSDDELSPENIATLENRIAEIEKRVKTEEDIALVSQAYMLIDKPTNAIAVLDKRINKTNSSKILTDLKDVAIIQKSVQELPTDFNKTQELKEKVSKTTTIDPRIKNYYKSKYIIKAQHKIHQNIKAELISKPNDIVTRKKFERSTATLVTNLSRSTKVSAKQIKNLAESQVMIGKPSQALKTLSTRVDEVTATDKKDFSQIKKIADFQKTIKIDPKIIKDKKAFAKALQKLDNSKDTKLYNYTVEPILKNTKIIK